MRLRYGVESRLNTDPQVKFFSLFLVFYYFRYITSTDM
jgi:hypothetical protein